MSGKYLLNSKDNAVFVLYLCCALRVKMPSPELYI